jgi:hypothetical protein
MRGEEKANYLGVIEKKIMASIKEAAWDEVGLHVDELRQKLLEAPPSKASVNWNAPAEPLGVAGLPEARLAWGVAEASGPEWMAQVPTSSGLLGDLHGRSAGLVHVSGQQAAFFDFRTAWPAKTFTRPCASCW